MNNKKEIIDKILLDEIALYDIPLELKTDEEVVLSLIQKFSVKSYNEFINEIFDPYGDYDRNEIKYIKETLFDDKSFVKNMLKLNGFLYKYISERLHDDKDVLLETLDYFKYHDNELNEEDWPNSGPDSYFEGRFRVLEFASQNLCSNRDIVKQAVLQNGFNIIYTPFTDDRELMLLAIEDDGMTFNYASQRLQEDEELITIALKGNPNLLKFISRETSNNSTFMLTAVKILGLDPLYYATEDLLFNKNFQDKVKEITGKDDIDFKALEYDRPDFIF